MFGTLKISDIKRWGGREARGGVSSDARLFGQAATGFGYGQPLAGMRLAGPSHGAVGRGVKLLWSRRSELRQ